MGIAVDNTIQGGTGDDTLAGGTGRGDGNDTLTGGSGAGDVVDYSARASGVTVKLDGLANDGDPTLSEADNASAESIVGGAGDDFLYADNSTATDTKLSGNDGDDILEGKAGKDSLSGGLGNDKLSPGTAADTIDGGGNRDIVLYTSAASAVTIDLDARTAQADGATDIVESVEGATGSVFDDTFYGDSGTNVFEGDAGNDAFFIERGDIGESDSAICGDDLDSVTMNATDTVTSDCENKTVIAPNLEIETLPTETSTETAAPTTDAGTTSISTTVSSPATTTDTTSTPSTPTVTTSTHARLTISGSRKQRPMRSEKRGLNSKVKCAGCKLRISAKITVKVKGKTTTFKLRSVSVSTSKSARSVWNKLSKKQQRKFKRLMRKKDARAKATIRVTGTGPTGTTATSAAGKSYAQLKVTIKR